MKKNKSVRIYSLPFYHGEENYERLTSRLFFWFGLVIYYMTLSTWKNNTVAGYIGRYSCFIYASTVDILI